MPVVEWTPDKFKLFKLAYDIAVKENKESFIFEGEEYVTGYAKYLIMYLETHFK